MVTVIVVRQNDFTVTPGIARWFNMEICPLLQDIESEYEFV